MVSKFSGVFRALIGSDESSSRRGTRKRALEREPQDVDIDILESPQVKRSRSSDSESSAGSSITSPSEAISKFASWIKVKGTSFAENYFFRPPALKPPENTNQVNRRDLNRRPIHESHSGRLPNMKSANRNTIQDQRSRHALNNPTKSHQHGGNHQQRRQPHNQHQQRQQKQRGGGLPPGARPKPAASSPDVILVNGNGHSEDHDAEVQIVDSHDQYRVPRSTGRNKATHRQHNFVVPQTASRSHIPRSVQTVDKNKPVNKTFNHPQQISKNYEPVVEKVFPRRTMSPRTRMHSTSTTANECVRLSEKQRYQDLLQQFTSTTRYKIPASSSLFTSQLSSSIHEHEPPPRLPHKPPSTQLTTDIGSLVRKPIVRREEPTVTGARIIPHNYNSRKEIIEAARLRLHVPVTELSPKATPIAGDKRNRMATPAQPDFSCDSRPESPVITAIKPSSPRSESRGVSPLTVFERSLRDSPYALEDWVKNMKDKFESSTRIRNRQAEEQEARVKLHEERRLREQTKLIDRIREQMTLAEKEEAVVDDPYVIEIEEEEEIEEIEDEIGEELVELTPEMEEEIDAALVPHPPNETLLEGFKLLITRHDVQTLNGLNWLNDEVINFYMQLIMARSQNDGFPNVHCFNTFFYPKLLKGGQQSLRRWTKRVDIFAKDLIVVPVHLGMHWCMAIVDLRSKTITYYDSMGSQNRKCLEALRDYLRAEHQDKKGSPYDLNGWVLTSAKDIPQQLNGSDCGMFACKFAEYITRDALITFTQHDMPYFRRRMVWEILHMKLL